MCKLLSLNSPQFEKASSAEISKLITLYLIVLYVILGNLVAGPAHNMKTKNIIFLADEEDIF